MSSVSRVPEASEDTGGPITAREAWAGVRSAGVRTVAGELANRFRFGDGFSHARALAFQPVLAALPLVIAAIGLAGAWDALTVRLVSTAGRAPRGRVPPSPIRRPRRP